MKKTSAIAKKPRHKITKERILKGARSIQKGDPAANTEKAIQALLTVATNKRNEISLRRASSTMKEILEKTPRNGRKIIRRLVQLDKTHKLSVSIVVRILSAPLATSTIKGHLVKFARKEISFNELMEHVERSYERMVPQSVMERVLHCRTDEFYSRMLKIAFDYDSPKSLVTNAALKRMHIFRMPAETIEAATNLRNRIHKTAHKMHAATRTGDKEHEKTKRKEMRALQKDFTRRFAKNL